MRKERLTYGPESDQFGDLYLPTGKGPYPLAILIHGGFWRAPYRLDLMEGLAEDLAQRGIAAWNIEYRRVGNPGGGWPGTLLDVGRACDWIMGRPEIDAQRAISIGHSAGGHLALWLAARHRLAMDSPLASPEKPLALRGAISLAGANDLEHVWRLNLGRGAAQELLGGTPEQYPERYAAASPAALLPLGVPQVLVHGDQDVNVPIEVSRAYAQKAHEAGDSVTLIELPGEEHFVVIDPRSEAWKLTQAEINRLYKHRTTQQ